MNKKIKEKPKVTVKVKKVAKRKPKEKSTHSGGLRVPSVDPLRLANELLNYCEAHPDLYFMPNFPVDFGNCIIHIYKKVMRTTKLINKSLFMGVECDKEEVMCIPIIVDYSQIQYPHERYSRAEEFGFKRFFMGNSLDEIVRKLESIT